jgi:hypothetical protein
VDLVGPFKPTPEGHKFVLTIIDHFTRFPIAVPITGKDMVTVARALKTHLFMAYPFWPRKIISDKGTDFVNGVIKEVYKQLHVSTILTSHDNPQANQVERFHRYMNAAISMFIRKKSDVCTWDQYVDSAVFVYRCSTNFTTGISPFYALYGKHPVRPLDYMLNMTEDAYDNNMDYTKDILATFREVYHNIHENQIVEADRNLRINKKLHIEYKVGDIVNVWRRRDPSKMDWRYAGPYTIHEKRNDNSYMINIGQWKTTTNEHAAGDMKTKTVSVRHIRAYKPFDDNITDTSHSFNDEEQEDEIIEDEEWDHDDPSTMVANTFCIIPYWGWQSLQREGTLWTTAKILQVYDRADTGDENDTILIHRYGSHQHAAGSQQRPGWINPRTTKIQFMTKPTAQFSVPLRNIISQTSPPFHTVNKLYNYDVLYHGFQLTPDRMLPLELQRRINNNKDIDENIDCKIDCP